MKTESTVPPVLTAAHVGAKCLYRIPNNRLVLEGIVHELSPGGDYVKIGKHWIEQGSGAVLAMLSGPTRRREAPL